jgi:hypothetical protein
MAQPDPQLFERRQNLSFRLAPPQRVLALERRNRLNGVCAADRLHAGFGQPEVLDLAFANQVLQRTRDVLDRDVRVHAVLIEEIDAVGPEALQRCLSHIANVRRTAIEACLLAVLELEPEFRRNHHLVANRPERLADQLFVRQWSVRFGRIEERHATVECRPKDREAVFTGCSGAVAKADAHAAETERRHFEPLLPNVRFCISVFLPGELRNGRQLCGGDRRAPWGDR